MPLVYVQKSVDFTDFTAHSRNFQIIYIFKSCKYSLRFMVQVCLDHAAHIYIWKVKNTESKLCIGSNQLIRVYTRAQPMQSALCGVQSVVCVCTLQHWSSQPVLSVSVTEPHRCIIWGIWVLLNVCANHDQALFGTPMRVHVRRLQSQLSYTGLTFTCITNSDQLIVSDAECFDSVFFTFHM